MIKHLWYVCFMVCCVLHQMIAADEQLDTPVLLLAFNRPDKQAKVFDRVRQVRPKQLFIAADGPRSHVKTDHELCKQTRQVMMNHIDWPCEVKTLFRDTNKGIDPAIVEAFDWVFAQVDRAIILEDDCLARPEFFWFCQAMLNRYKEDSRVYGICGFKNPDSVFQGPPPKNTYFFTYPRNHHWGWATWRRAWKVYDQSMSFFPHFKERKLAELLYPDKEARDYTMRFWNVAYSKGPNTKNNHYLWDCRFALSVVARDGCYIYPSVNLIENIGFDQSATHVKTPLQAYWRQQSVAFDVANLEHPSFVISP